MFWINWAIAILGIIIAILPVFKFTGSKHRIRNRFIIFFGLSLIVLSYIKGNDDKKKEQQASKDSSNIESLTKGQNKMIADRIIDSTNYRIFFDSLKSKFSIIRDSSNQPIFIGINNKGVVQQNKNGNNQANVNNGSNTGIIGNNGTINKEKIIHPSKEIIKMVEDSIRNKNENVYIKYAGEQSAKNRQFCVELIDIIRKDGYPNNFIIQDNFQLIGSGMRNFVDIKESEGNYFMLVGMY